MLFTELKKAMSNMEGRRSADGSLSELDMAKIKALGDVVTVIESGVWTSKESTKDRIWYAWVYGRKECAEFYRTTVNSIKGSMLHASKLIYEMIGQTYISDVLAAESVEEVNKLAGITEVKELIIPERVFGKSFLSLLPEGGLDRAEVNDLFEFLNFLKLFTLDRVKEIISEEYSNSASSFVCYLLKNSYDDARGQSILRFILGECSESDVEEVLGFYLSGITNKE